MLILTLHIKSLSWGCISVANAFPRISQDGVRVYWTAAPMNVTYPGPISGRVLSIRPGKKAPDGPSPKSPCVLREYYQLALMLSLTISTRPSVNAQNHGPQCWLVFGNRDFQLPDYIESGPSQNAGRKCTPQHHKVMLWMKPVKFKSYILTAIGGKKKALFVLLLDEEVISPL